MERLGFMTKADLKILEHLRDHGVAKPGRVADEKDVTRVHAGRRLKILADHGFVEIYDVGIYTPTDKARAFFRGELDEDDVPSGD